MQKISTANYYKVQFETYGFDEQVFMIAQPKNRFLDFIPKNGQNNPKIVLNFTLVTIIIYLLTMICWFILYQYLIGKSRSV